MHVNKTVRFDWSAILKVSGARNYFVQVSGTNFWYKFLECGSPLLGGQRIFGNRSLSATTVMKILSMLLLLDLIVCS